ncbi:MAG: glycosyltransferase [Bacteroidetes bacterium]|nr:glycosyltransferase [Bacteroidota bacterium]
MEMFMGIFFWVLETFCFVLFAGCATYLLMFSFFSKRSMGKEYPGASRFHRFAVLFPAYKEDIVIVDSILNFLKQEYPVDLYDVVVISDGMKLKTVDSLREMGTTVMEVNFEKSSKAIALNFAMAQLDSTNYDVVVVLDADNHVEPNFLHKLNNAYSAGVMAMQAHRVAKNRNSEIAYLDGVSEEINNSIFRKGHANVGFSSALSGSGMAFDFAWFKRNIIKVDSVGEDKELELLLLQDRIHIAYLEHVLVRDEKVQKAMVFSQQRQRWLTAQHTGLSRGFRHFFQAFCSGNIDYCNKLVQWMIPPRLILLGATPFVIVLIGFISFSAIYKWICFYFLLVLAIRLAIPAGLFDRKVKHALRQMPQLFIRMLISMFQLKKKGTDFIHTPHGEDE